MSSNAEEDLKVPDPNPSKEEEEEHKEQNGQTEKTEQTQQTEQKKEEKDYKILREDYPNYDYSFKVIVIGNSGN